MIILFTIITVSILQHADGSSSLKIGAIFDTEDEYKLRAFNLAVDELNNSGLSKRYTFEAVSKTISSNDPEAALAATCSMIADGIVAILGPSEEHNSRMVQSACDNKDIPLLDVRWVDEPGNAVINFHPKQDVLSHVHINVLEALEFLDFVVLYEDNDSLKRIGRFLEECNKKLYKYTIKQLDNSGDGNHRKILKEIKQSGATHLFLDCSTEILSEVLVQAQQVGLMTEKHNFIITNLDLHTLDLTTFQYSDTKIIGMRIVNPDSEKMIELSSKLFQRETSENPLFALSGAWRLKTDTILIMDSIAMLGNVVQDLPENLIPPSMTCSGPEVWNLGSTIINLIKGNHYYGYSKSIEFGREGYRNNFEIDILQLAEGGIITIGNWTLSNNFVLKKIFTELEESKMNLKDQHFNVVISLIEPFAFHTPTAYSLSGNDRYQGYSVDLIHELSVMEGFNYTFINQEDKKNGDYNEVLGKWDGMIGAILENRADLAIADLTITSDRQKYVDFTNPFMNLGISILYQKARKAAPSFFSFADPFALEVWILVAVSFVAVSLVLFILGRICSSEWSNPYPCIEEPEFLVNQLSLRNCFWFASGSIMQQGSEIGPVAVSTRMVAGMWWFFTLIMVSSYTANLTAFLTNETPDPHFSNIHELVMNAEKKGIKWGAKKGGSTVKFFNASRIQTPDYGIIFDYIMEHADDVLVSDPNLGVEKAEKENYAFFMESISIEYETARRCNLTMVGNLLDEKSYGIAVRKNSTYRPFLSRAILDLQHSGKLNELKRKWWEEKRGGGFCNAVDSSAGQALSLKNVGGIFWVTFIGSLLGIILGIVELILHTLKVRITSTEISFFDLIKEEFKFYFKFSKRVKPVIYNSDCNNK